MVVVVSTACFFVFVRFVEVEVEVEVEVFLLLFLDLCCCPASIDGGMAHFQSFVTRTLLLGLFPIHLPSTVAARAQGAIHSTRSVREVPSWRAEGAGERGGIGLSERRDVFEGLEVVLRGAESRTQRTTHPARFAFLCTLFETNYEPAVASKK